MLALKIIGCIVIAAVLLILLSFAFLTDHSK